jgi:SAM-dependent methyltransferase
MNNSHTTGDERIQMVRAHYNRLAGTYRSCWEEGGALAAFFTMKRQGALQMLMESPHRFLLEIGCGPGMMVEQLIQEGFQYVGTDISDGMIAQCNNRFRDDPRTRFVVSNIERLPFRDQTFPAVLCLGVLEYLDGLDRAIAEVARVLTPGGVFVFSLLNRRSPYRTAQKLYRPGLLPFKLYTDRYIMCLLQRHGFQTTACDYFHCDVVPPPLDERYPRATCRLCGYLETHCPRSLKKWLASAFVIKATR